MVKKKKSTYGYKFKMNPFPGLGAQWVGVYTKRLQVRSPVRACMEGNPSMFLSSVDVSRSPFLSPKSVCPQVRIKKKKKRKEALSLAKIQPICPNYQFKKYFMKWT